MSAGFLIDTNILVYAVDPQEPEKKGRAREALRRLADGGNGALPAQALSEFSNVCLRKLRPTLSIRDIEREVERLLRAFSVLPLSAPVVLEALRGVREHQFSYYDGQIWAVARLGQIPIVLSEDFNTGSVVEGISFVNPLDEAFDPASLG